MLEKGGPVVVEGAQDARIAEVARREGFVAFAGVPLLSDGVTIGANGTNNRFINNYGPQPSTCSANDRGSVWYSFAAAGTLDSYQACRKDAADAYAWTALF